ncbi:MAG: hydroxymethylbilane synthase [Bacteroidetes bacterium]|nr:hydroxymethylbilane synthase [Bacteroidota bacterium]
MTKSIRIGSRESSLAMYQARTVQKKFKDQGFHSEIIQITSDGDVDLVTPLYEMGIQGIFTKSLDSALLQDKIDVAVHSSKDIPTRLAQGLSLSALLERGTPFDCLVLPKGKTIELDKECVIGTSSMRRKSQWLHRYPHHRTENLRGNIQTRLSKLDHSGWNGALFAQAALERLAVSTHQFITLDWMLPSPSQGAIGVVCREDDAFARTICSSINHTWTELCISAERDFLAALHGGCSVPIAALATIDHNRISFRGNVFSLDAKDKCEVELTLNLDQAKDVGKIAAQKILELGANKIIKTFRPNFED